jgi:hypothetical protein
VVVAAGVVVVVELTGVDVVVVAAGVVVVVVVEAARVGVVVVVARLVVVVVARLVVVVAAGVVVVVELVVVVVAAVVVVETVAAAQVGTVTTLLSSVTAPLRANTRPLTSAPVFRVIDVRARIDPAKLLVVPSVAELPTCQNTWQACAPFSNTTRLDDAPISVDPA